MKSHARETSENLLQAAAKIPPLGIARVSVSLKLRMDSDSVRSNLRLSRGGVRQILFSAPSGGFTLGMSVKNRSNSSATRSLCFSSGISLREIQRANLPFFSTNRNDFVDEKFSMRV